MHARHRLSTNTLRHDLTEHASHAQTDRAVPAAGTASGAQNVTKFIRIRLILVPDSVSLSGDLVGTRIVPGGVQGVHHVLARVPVSDPASATAM